MAQTLLYKTLIKKLHIALIVLMIGLSAGSQLFAQADLKPGDVVVVSVDADTNSVDIMPLVDIERGTSIFLNDGRWSESAQELTGNEVGITFLENITAGTNINILAYEDSLYDIKGKLEFGSGVNRVFIYQKKRILPKFIYAAGWGGEFIWANENEAKSSDVPKDLIEANGSVLTLGKASNQRYFIRKGASGTKAMLNRLISDPSNWVTREDQRFKPFGISFNLLSAPVIQFDRTLSKVSENDSTATVRVAIYEHDGSRLSVDLVFDSLRSIAGELTFKDFEKQEINFTGIVGDYMHEIKIPVLDDEIFSGRDIGIFRLEKLTKGSFGDFLTHNLIVEEDEKPKILISKVAADVQGNSFIELTNNDLVPVNISGWSIKSENSGYTFGDDIWIDTGETVRWYDVDDPELVDENIKDMLISGLKEPIIDADADGGALTLKNDKDRIIYQVQYSKKADGSIVKSNSSIITSRKITGNNTQSLRAQNNELSSEMAILDIENPGWKVLPVWEGIFDDFEEKELYGWSEEKQRFYLIDRNSLNKNIVLGFFDSNEINSILAKGIFANKKAINRENLTLSISGTDKNNNSSLDRLEGLNLLYNTLDESITVSALTEAIKSKYPDVAQAPIVFSMIQGNEGQLMFQKMQRKEKILPYSPFWLLLDQSTQKTELSFTKNDFMKSAIDDTDDSQDEASILSLKLEDASKETDIRISFTEEEKFGRSKDLNSYPELYLPDQIIPEFSFKQGEDFYDHITIARNMKQSVELPVYFGNTEGREITISVSEWESIPDGWSIVLIDKDTDKEYKLGQDFSMTTAHSFTQVDRFDSPFSFDQKREQDRFVVRIIPEKLATDNRTEEVDDTPNQIELYQNYPNPFNPATIISFYLPESQEVKLSVFNIVGQPVAVLIEGTLSAGKQTFEWDATDKPSGMYIYQLEVGNRVMTRKMTLVK